MLVRTAFILDAESRTSTPNPESRLGGFTVRRASAIRVNMYAEGTLCGL
jgi:hypothetical protein